MKKLIVFMLTVAMVFAMTACGGETKDATAGKVRVLTPNATHGFLGESIKHAQAECEALKAAGMDIECITSAEASEQNNQLDTIINEGADVVVLWPHNGDELRSGAQKVMDAGIKLVVYDRLIDGFTPTVEIMGDNVTIGKMTGEYFNKFFAEDLKAGPVNVLEFKGDNSTVPQQRSDGFLETADANIKVVQQFSTDWQRAKAQEQMETFLTTSSKATVESIKAVFTHDDEVVLGVLDAIAAYNGPATLNIKVVSGVGGRQENLDTFAPMKDSLGINQVTYSFSPAMVRDAITLGADIAKGKSDASGMVLIPTEEVDNTNEVEYRSSDTFKTRYSLDK